MKVIKIDASPKQLSRLRNGHKVRVKSGAMTGTGFNLMVDPSKFDAMSRTFAKGSAFQVSLSPEELMANKKAVMEGEIEGEGIFAGGKLKIGKAFKKAGSALKDVAKKTGTAIVDAEKAVRKSPVGRKIVKKAVPILADVATRAALTYMGADPKTASAFGSISKEGATAGLTEAGYGLYAGQQQGRGMYAGQGLYAGRGLLGPPSRMPEMSSISIGGTLLSKMDRLPPALQSDPMGANFHANTQLMPQYQRGGIRFV